jgi:hypothetical protein
MKLGQTPKLTLQVIKRHDTGEPAQKIALGIASETSLL